MTSARSRPDLALGIGWLATRAVLAWAALSTWYGQGTGAIRPWSDVELYARYATDVLAGATPYTEVAIEYPAGSLPLILAPGVLAALPGVDYLGAFVALALLLDLAGLVALRRLAGQWGAATGPWAWVAGVALLGPVVLLRLDLLPVVAVLWAAERAAAGRWTATGGLLAAGAAAKLWPAGLLPIAWLVAPRRGRDVLLGAAAVGGVVLVLGAGVLGPMVEASVLRNLGRQLQLETLWASLLLAAQVLGVGSVEVGFADGADHVTGTAVAPLAWIARMVPIVAVATGVWLVRRTPGRLRQAVAYAVAAEVVTLVLLAGGGVLSVQFLLWGVGAVAAVACHRDHVPHTRLALVGLACLLTAIEFPWAYGAVADARPPAVVLLLARNLALLAAAVHAVRSATRISPGTGGPASVPARR